MTKQQWTTAVSFQGAGENTSAARRHQAERIREFADDFEKGRRTDDVGIQVLYDGDPGGGGPCRPQKLRVADVILTVPLPEAKSRDD